MTDTTTPAALEIPQAAADAARDALWDCLPDTYDMHDMAFLACYLEDYALPAGAGGIVAAELRRIADEARTRDRVAGAVRYADGYFDGASMVRDLLINRANELDVKPHSES